MKFFILLPLTVLLSLYFSLTATTQKNKASLKSELTDRQGVVFARNLTDWRGKPIDSVMMDMYYPTAASSEKNYPVIIFCHGGGFSGGNRFNVMAACDRFADMGFIAVAVDYRVGYKKGKGDQACETDSVSFNEATYRACQDVNAAFRYLVANAEGLNVDTSALFVGGSSAGGALALMDVYLNDSTAQIYYPAVFAKLGSLQRSGNNLTHEYKIKGIISMWGALSYADVLIDQDYTAVPAILFKGTEEGGIPDSVGHYRGCETMPIVFSAPAIYAKLISENTSAVYHTLPLANHPAYDIEFCVEQSTCFLKAILEDRSYSGTYMYFNPSCQ